MLYRYQLVDEQLQGAARDPASTMAGSFIDGSLLATQNFRMVEFRGFYTVYSHITTSARQSTQTKVRLQFSTFDHDHRIQQILRLMRRESSRSCG
jgi:hypothetical protein